MEVLQLLARHPTGLRSLAALDERQRRPSELVGSALHKTGIGAKQRGDAQGFLKALEEDSRWLCVTVKASGSARRAVWMRGNTPEGPPQHDAGRAARNREGEAAAAKQ